MKLKTLKSTYEIIGAEHENGKLNIIFSEKTCEELQNIFSVKEDISIIEIYDDESLIAVIPEDVVLERIVLSGDTKTVVLGKETDDVEKRITSLSENVADTATTAEDAQEKTKANTENIEKISADMDYIAMQMEVELNV